MGGSFNLTTHQGHTEDLEVKILGGVVHISCMKVMLFITKLKNYKNVVSVILLQ